MPEILPNPFTDPKKLPKRSLFDREKKDEKQVFIDQALAKGLQAAQESTKKKFADSELQDIWDAIEKKIESGEIKIHDITIGDRSKEQLMKAIETAGMEIFETAKELMNNEDYITSEEESDFELIELSVADLGFPGGATRGEIYERAKELKLEIVPAEAGPQLRLVHADQAKNEIILIGMEPIKEPSGDPYIFVVSHIGDDRTLGLHFGDNVTKWYKADRWVFRRK